MKNSFVFLGMFAFLLSFQTMAQSYSGAESVEFDYANNRYLISNNSSKQILARAADGTLSIFATLPSAPYGIEIVGDTLYCCTGGNLRGLNLNTGVEIFNHSVESGAFFNGITHDPSGNIYITGFSSKKVYRFNTLTRQSNIYVNNTATTPNGIVFDAYDGQNSRLLMAGWGSPATIKAISMADSSVSLLLNTPFSNIDGIAKGKDGYFYIAVWSNNSIQRYDSTFSTQPTSMVSSGLTSPADIFYNSLTDTLAVPCGSFVNFYFFGTITQAEELSLQNTISVFPNPAQHFIQLRSTKALGPTQAMLIETASGKVVYTAELNISEIETHLQLDRQNVAPGLYTFIIKNAEGLISRDKIVLF